MVSPSRSRAYQEIAERCLNAAQALINQGFHELAIFLCYHAFESIACSALALTQIVPERHNEKIKQFLGRCRGQLHKDAAILAREVEDLRNQALYPSGHRAPHTFFTPNQAIDILQRTRSVVQRVISDFRL